MGEHNPWLTATHEPKPDEATMLQPMPMPPATGPVRPQRGVDELDAVDRLPRRTPAVPAVVWWLGVHGGAGETTLAELLPGSRAAEHHWPAERDPVTARPVVLVCRSHARGLHAAQKALTDWASGAVQGVDLLGLVIIADAPQRTPRPLRDLARIIGGGAPTVWHLPWVEALRYAPSTTSTTPAAARRVLRDITRLTGATPQTATPTVNPAVAIREDS